MSTITRIIPPLPPTERGVPSNNISMLDGPAVYGAGSSIVVLPSSDGPALVNYHNSKVTAVAISPSRAWIASADSKGQVSSGYSGHLLLLRLKSGDQEAREFLSMNIS